MMAIVWRRDRYRFFFSFGSFVQAMAILFSLCGKENIMKPSKKRASRHTERLISQRLCIFAIIITYNLPPMKRKIHHEGIGIIISFALLFIVANLATYFLVSHKILFILTFLVTGTLLALVLNFFRFPHRHNSDSADPRVIVSPADGKVVVIEEVYEGEYLRRRCLKVSVFMSVFDVHANWFACHGKVLASDHHSGAFYKAFLPKSSTDNERSALVTQTIAGPVLQCQIAGAVARRIVTYPTVGDPADVSDFMGFIKFGSRIDLYLPLTCELKVKVGDVVSGHTTTLGFLPPEEPSIV